MDATNAFVLDGSITMVWGVEDESDAYAEAILDKMPGLPVADGQKPTLGPLCHIGQDNRSDSYLSQYTSVLRGRTLPRAAANETSYGGSDQAGQ
jgi:hypothetical protein